VSGNTSNDVITLSQADLAANKTYYIYTKSTSSRDRGSYSSASYPYTSSDGNLSTTNGYFDGSLFSGTAYAISEIGNINL